MKHLIIIGAGGFGREIYCCATECIGYGIDFDIKGFLDPNGLKLDKYEGYPPIIGVEENYIIEADDVFTCAFGDVHLKQKCCEKILKQGGEFLTLIHKTAYISKNVSIGKGCIIMAATRISCDVNINDFVSIQPEVNIGHDVSIGSWSHINTNVICSGAVQIGQCVTIHTSAVIVPQAVIEDNSVVGAGSVTRNRVKKGQIVMGVPAKPLILPGIK